MHFYSWKKGLKTGMYYLRTKPKAHAIQFTVDQEVRLCVRSWGRGVSCGLVLFHVSFCDAWVTEGSSFGSVLVCCWTFFFVFSREVGREDGVGCGLTWSTCFFCSTVTNI